MKHFNSSRQFFTFRGSLNSSGLQYGAAVDVCTDSPDFSGLHWPQLHQCTAMQCVSVNFQSRWAVVSSFKIGPRQPSLGCTGSSVRHSVVGWGGGGG